MIEILSQGGPLLYVIALCGIVATLVFLERALHLHRARIRSEDFLNGIFNNIRRGNIDEALNLCSETPGPVASLMKTAILHRHNDATNLRSALDDIGSAELMRAERRLVVITAIAQITPLLGLLGTVAAMIRALLIMNQQAPLVPMADLSYWLMQALVTTAAGLSVAIPAYAAFHFLANRVERIVIDMERASTEIMGFITGDDSVTDTSATTESHYENTESNT